MASSSLFPVQAYQRFAEDAQATTFVTAASLALLLYDHAITFGQEVRLFWRGRWSFPRILFFWNRYFAIIVLAVNLTSFVTKGASNDVCQVWFIFEGITGLLAVIVSDLIMIMRLRILYEKRKAVMWFLVLLFIAEAGASLTLVGLGLVIPPASDVLTIEEDARFRHLVSGCYPSAYPKVLAAWFFPPLITAVILFLMTAYKCAWSFKLRDRRSQAPLITLFLDHGVVYLVCIVGTLASNAFVFFFARATIAGVGIGLAVSVLSVTGSRLLLDLKTVSVSLSAPPTSAAEMSTFQVAGREFHAHSEESAVTTLGGSSKIRSVATEETDETLLPNAGHEYIPMSRVAFYPRATRVLD